MKRSLVLLFLSIVLVFSIAVPASAAGTVWVDLRFDPVSKIVDKESRTWSTSSSNVDFVGNRANLRGGKIFSESGISGFITDVNNQRDFYVETVFRFYNFDSNVQKIFEKNTNFSELGLWYDKPNKKFNYSFSDSVTGVVTGSFAEQFDLTANTDYKIAYGRSGSNMVLYVNDVAATPVPLTNSLVASSNNWVYIGSDVAPTTEMSVSIFKMVSGIAYAPAGADSSQTPQVSIASGSLELSSSGVAFEEVVFNSSTVQSITTTSSVSVKDDRVQGAGWNMKISASRLISTTMPDPSGGSGTIQLSLPPDALSVSSGNISVNSGQAIHGSYGPFGNNITLGYSPQTLMYATPGFGMGSYVLPLTYTLTVPKTATVESVTGTGSKYKSGDTVGIIKGTYEGTITYTIGTGL